MENLSKIIMDEKNTANPKVFFLENRIQTKTFVKNG